MITFLDDYSGLGSILFLKRKSDAKTSFKDWLMWAERQSGKRLLKLRSDRGGEYLNLDLQAFLSAQGIEHQKTVPHTPQQNGRAERFNRTILEKAEAMRHHACLSPSFWQDSVETALHIYNCQPMRRIDWKPPITLWDGTKPNVSYFRTFGCLAYVFIPKEVRKDKLAPKAEVMTFIGYEQGTKGYRFWSKTRQRVVISHNATFDETHFPHCLRENIQDKPPLPNQETQSIQMVLIMMTTVIQIMIHRNLPLMNSELPYLLLILRGNSHRRPNVRRILRGDQISFSPVLSFLLLHLLSTSSLTEESSSGSFSRTTMFKSGS
jgi:hypothetical protein